MRSIEFGSYTARAQRRGQAVRRRERDSRLIGIEASASTRKALRAVRHDRKCTHGCVALAFEASRSPAWPQHLIVRTSARGRSMGRRDEARGLVCVEWVWLDMSRSVVALLGRERLRKAAQPAHLRAKWARDRALGGRAGASAVELHRRDVRASYSAVARPIQRSYNPPAEAENLHRSMGYRGDEAPRHRPAMDIR